MRKFQSFFNICLFVFLSTHYSIGQNTTHTDKINELVSKYAEYGKFNGSVLVAEKGNVIYKKSFGLANVEWDIPNQPNTKFRIASVTKQFTAMLIMQLVSENKISLEEPISSYLSSYPKESGEKINIHHLLTHTSGITNYTSFSSYHNDMRNPKSPEELIKTFADSTLQFEPGEKFSYSNSGYVLLGAIIEAITGKTYAKVLEEKIFTPLKMTSTGFYTNKDVLKNKASGFYDNGITIEHSSHIEMSMAYSAGGIYSTVEDLYLWDQALYTEQLLPDTHREMLFTKHIPAWGKSYGYGWFINDLPIGDSEERIQTMDHDGVINGFSSIIIRIPSDNSTIILLNNSGGAPHYEISRAIMGILYDKEYHFPKKSVARSLPGIIIKDGIIEGQSFFNRVKNSSDFSLDENEINRMAYDLMKSDYIQEALTIFKLNMEEFPYSFNTYDSYGEVLLGLGDTTNAIKNYKTSIELNPKNETGIQVLEKLGVPVNRDDLYLVKTDNSWYKAIIPMPFHFAKGINYKGVEQSYFPKGWRDMESNEYWSYILAWNVNRTTELEVDELEREIEIYFDGLMSYVNRDKSKELSNTVANFQKSEIVNGIAKFYGTIETFDAFITNKTIKLNVRVEKHYCKIEKKSIILFKFSPQNYENEIWQILNKLTVRENACKSDS